VALASWRHLIKCRRSFFDTPGAITRLRWLAARDSAVDILRVSLWVGSLSLVTVGPGTLSAAW